MTYRAAYRKVMREYEYARDGAAALLEARKAEVYSTVPEIKEIDYALAKIGSGLSKLALAGDTQGMANARQEAEALKAKRQALLKSTVGESYLVNVFRCMACQDTGFIQETPGSVATRCKCLRQRLINEYYALSNIKGALEEENFDTFDYRIFSTETVREEGLSPRENMQTVYRLATQFVRDFGTTFDNLLLYGEPGLGKTFVSHCIAKDLLDAGKTVLYQTAPRLCKILEDYRFNREAMREPDEMIAAVDDVDLLILDDLGAEIPTVVTSAALFDIINQRLLARKPTVISTNLTPVALTNQYSERLVSRFFNYQMIKFFGEDLRVKKKYGGLRI